MKNSRLALFTLTAALLGAPALAANKVTFKDPTGDDNGPGTYKYPTDPVYKPGSFDLTEFTFDKKGKKADITLSFNTDLADDWKTGNGFSVQMAFVFIDTDGKPGSGSTDGLPGLNVKFAPEFGWEKAIVISPQGAERVKSEVNSKTGALKGNVIIPTSVKGSDKSITATIDASGLKGEPSQWRYQVLIQSNEGFPGGNDLLTRKVNEFEGQHRFGGGNDGECDPHVLDLLAGAGTGEESETKAQHDMLAYECAADGSAKKGATLTMVGAGVKAPETKPMMGSETKPMGSETKPMMGSETKPMMGSEAKPMGSETKPMAPETKPMAPETKPTPAAKPTGSAPTKPAPETK